MFALAKGQWAGALRFNGLSPLAFAMLFSLFWSGPIRNRLWTAGLGAFAVYGLAAYAASTGTARSGRALLGLAACCFCWNDVQPI